MIGRLRGSILEAEPSRLVIDVGGVGYEVQIPLSSFYGLPEAADGGGQNVELFIHTHVREESFQLFGFLTRAERTFFERLIGISGVGPKMALAFLSGIGINELIIAVRDEDKTRLQQIPGVGKKTAERVLLELKDRLDLEPAAPTDSQTAVRATGSSSKADAISALVNLGYARDKAADAVERTLAERADSSESDGNKDPSLETVIRSALRRLLTGA
jgi:Holliday junction DNA helicase RuvA